MPTSKKVIISVISDLATDQRVHRSALTLHEMGYDVSLVGRKLRKSLALDERPYKTIRLNLLFEKGVFMYAEWHVRLFFYLLLNKCCLLFANDLDTLLPNYLASKIYQLPIIYDSHEYFTEVPELQNNPFRKKVWKRVEQYIFPRLKHTITVNDSIAGLFYKNYGKKPLVVRNVPLANNFNRVNNIAFFKTENEIPEDKKIIIIQGAGINIQRGAEEAVEAMKHLPDCVLLVIGSGDVYNTLLKLSAEHNVGERIVFISRLPYSDLMEFTQIADVGLTLDKNTNINYRYSLPNKLFDYIQAGIPVISSDLTEVTAIVKKFDIGMVINNVTPSEIANAIKNLFRDNETYTTYRNNTKAAAAELNWSVERKKLEDLIRTIFAKA
ncbi:MAG TPA: glycosyltransferase [Bacteroidia bacterium]|nr:glycosyltransferase [Bacteroidia bacterium]HNU34020.1 glycosyltransferase [Bacteroidia bacterium]